jgi:hypothetical protein
MASPQVPYCRLCAVERAAATARRPLPSLAVHPVAALFPMLADDELADLAIDIKQNGLKFPIIRR